MFYDEKQPNYGLLPEAIQKVTADREFSISMMFCS